MKAVHLISLLIVTKISLTFGSEKNSQHSKEIQCRIESVELRSTHSSKITIESNAIEKKENTSPKNSHLNPKKSLSNSKKLDSNSTKSQPPNDSNQIQVKKEKDGCQTKVYQDGNYKIIETEGERKTTNGTIQFYKRIIQPKDKAMTVEHSHTFDDHHSHLRSNSWFDYEFPNTTFWPFSYFRGLWNGQLSSHSQSSKTCTINIGGNTWVVSREALQSIAASYWIHHFKTKFTVSPKDDKNIGIQPLEKWGIALLNIKHMLPFFASSVRSIDAHRYLTLSNTLMSELSTYIDKNSSSKARALFNNVLCVENTNSQESPSLHMLIEEAAKSESPYHLRKHTVSNSSDQTASTCKGDAEDDDDSNIKTEREKVFSEFGRDLELLAYHLNPPDYTSKVSEINPSTVFNLVFSNISPKSRSRLIDLTKHLEFMTSLAKGLDSNHGIRTLGSDGTKSKSTHSIDLQKEAKDIAMNACYSLFRHADTCTVAKLALHHL
jgi:hypothetical protein